MKSLRPGLLLITLVIALGCQKELKGDLVIQNVNVINVENGEISPSQDVLIIGDSIATIEAHGQFKFSASETVDGTDKYLIPGLWDMHGHWIDDHKDFFPMLLANGVTGIRDMWGNFPALKKVRQKLEDGSLIGPDVLSAGFIVDGLDPIQSGCSVVASTPDEGRKIVREQQSAGADFIKVYNKLERDVYFAIADECQKQNIALTGHIPFKIALSEAVNARHSSIEHFYGFNAFTHRQYESYLKKLQGEDVEPDLNEKTRKLSERVSINSLEWDIDNFDRSRIPELVELLAKSDTWITPTLAINKGYFLKYEPYFDPSYLNGFMPDHVISDSGKDYYAKDTLRTEQDRKYFEFDKNYYRFGVEMLKPLFDGGVKFISGTDYVVPFAYPGFTIHEELQILVEEGRVTSLQALQTATLNPAIFLKKENELGIIETGKRASLLLLNENPLEDIKNTRKIEGLILRGKYYSSDTLSKELHAVRERNTRPQIREKLDTIIRQEGIDEAIEQFAELKKNSPGKFDFNKRQLVTLGHILLDEKKITEAIKIFELNIEHYPELSHSFNGLGDAYLAAGQKEKAIKAWQRSQDLGAYSTEEKIKKLKNKDSK